ncbi:hypothetical protein CONLIGDRAFT_28360 [Coniochaeta ligniaria NRRL 30616]|uniref:Uncharacterized protein n=1 Tax=Coniochaeta ligniaria NRRL 30616 TaxID=1408157 RepID=A0A1J7JZK2_9PEZI|nr:hypothetical protein CONLIGDRAFT_28360 [Coniochaeta ligniaria NRRL 30616]
MQDAVLAYVPFAPRCVRAKVRARTHFRQLLLTFKRQGNITVAFFPDSEEATCNQNDIANAASLTTRTIPTSWICFNLTDLFSQPSDTGSKNGSQYAQPKPYHGVDYLLSNRDSYKADANYTNVWHQQVNITGNTEPGTDGAWVLYTYAFADCLPYGGDDFEQDEWPFFETSCQTKREGECRQLPKGVKSFAIGPAKAYNARHGGHCEVWARLGGASVVNPRTAALLVVAVAMILLL